MKKYVIFCFVLLLGIPCRAQYDISIIPEPKEVYRNDGLFKLSKTTCLQLNNDALKKTASLFNSYLKDKFGVALNISSLKKGSSKKKFYPFMFG